MSFDLSALDTATPADRGAWCTLRNPLNGEDLPIKIKIAGEGSQVWRNQERKFQDSRLEKTYRQSKAPKILTRDIEDRANKILAAATMEWQDDGLPYLSLGSEQLACNPANAEKLYSDVRFRWIRDQLDEFTGNPENYSPEAAAKPSSLMDAEAYQGEVIKN